MSDKAKKILRRLYGHPCWNPRRGYGSALLFEFGQPRLEIGNISKPMATQPVGSRFHYRSRVAAVRGKWGILIDGFGWQIIQHNDKLARWTSSKQRIDRALRVLHGQALCNIDIDLKKSLTTFEFDLGAKLSTFPYSNETDDHWTIYHSGKDVLSFSLNGLQVT